jgi:HSF-type DNA-binding
MPHGRSFKIHKQLEFAEIILPRYFVMTKKSSFLRQLNLYGFNRFSAGQDQGSYYHEKFLRGCKFLCRRMTRQKVNGNRIRSAGNPDDEPVLAHYPSCPRGYTDPPVTPGDNSPQSSSLAPNKRSTYIAQEEEDDEDANDAERRQCDESQDQDEEDDNEGDGDDDGTATTCSNSATKVPSTPQPFQQLPRNNSGSQVSFPLKLQRMLDKVEADGMLDAISWLSHGRAFTVRNPEIFVEKLMPLFFNQTKYNSFLRQLNLYNFQRITTGRDKGAWHHAYFQRGKPHLCIRMVRTKVNGTGCRKPGNPSSEPNLYSMQPLPAIPPGTVIEVPTGSPEGDETSDSDA